MKKAIVSKTRKSAPAFPIPVLPALKRALKRARQTAKMHGTKLYFSRDGKIVAEKP